MNGMVKSFYKLVEGIENADVKPKVPRKKVKR
jgi:hypothetical protein